MAAARDVKGIAKTVLGRSGLARRARNYWWSMQDRAVAERTRDIRAHLSLVDETIDAQRKLNTEFGESLHDKEQRQHATELRADELQRSIDDHVLRHSVEPFGMAEAGFSLEEVEGLGRALGASGLEGSGDRYADFLAVFRGPYERVRELVVPYGPILKGQGPLLDIGCGRGELLDVAKEAGIEARGIDLDVELVRQAVELGFDAEVGDGIAALREAPDGSLGSVSAIHVVEHLPVDQLEAFFAEALRALRPGGLLITETINPHETSAASTFWVDPTHRGPVFPEVSLALALSTGFDAAHVFAPDGTGDWEHDRSRSTRYALIARR